MTSTSSSERQSAVTITPRRIAAVVLLALFVVFAVQNRAATTVQLLVFDMTGALWLTLIVSFVLGSLVSWLLIGRRRR